MEQKLRKVLEDKAAELPPQRKQLLDAVVAAAKQFDTDEKIPLVFVCTHNSRRSQMAQAWFYALCQEMHLEQFIALSAGTEDTAFHPNAIGALQQHGFTFTSQEEGENPKYWMRWKEHPPISMYSKTLTAVLQDHTKCIAVMVCDHADANCPVIPEATARISLPFEDPKKADGGPNPRLAYQEKSLEIAAHMLWLASAFK